MMERRSLVAQWQQDPAGTLVTLVAVEGSSYRRPGARMLVPALGGSVAGTISGGCLESDVMRRAAWLTRNGAAVERYSMAFDDTDEIPFGLGCGGAVDLLLEPLDTPEAVALMQAMARSLEGSAATVVSFLPGGGRGLRRLVVDGAGTVLFASEGLAAAKIACASALEPGREYEGRFVERLAPPLRLFVFGAGEDARPLAGMGSLLGWTVIVTDGREQLLRAERFPAASAVVDTAQAMAMTPGAEDAVVLMTHSYEQDRALLRMLLPARPGYLGLLGSRHRSSLLLRETAAALHMPLDAVCGAVFAPVGLDLGGDGPEAVALAIVAEVQAVREGKAEAARRMTPQEVERQIAEKGSSAVLRGACAMESA